MSNAVEYLLEEIERHEDRQLEINREIRALEAEKAAIAVAVKSLQSVLDKVEGEHTQKPATPVPSPPTNGKHHPADVIDAALGASRKVTHVTFAYVQAHPKGLRPSEIADAIADRIDSKSADPRKVVMNTLVNLANDGKIGRTDDGKYRPLSEEEREDEQEE